MLATLRIGKAKDEMGLEIDVEPEFATGLSPYVKLFVLMMALVIAEQQPTKAVPVLDSATF